ncbi:MAG: hypothetical protein QOI24_2759 [Acidobacteriota bacterium]|nr:hypothetical protein [Acidobacteriota bacterium]
MHRTFIAVETEVRHMLLPVTLSLDVYERIIVRGRVKDCESAVDSLRRRQEFGFFDTDRPEDYSLRSLKDLVGVRVLTFPNRRLEDARKALLSVTDRWVADPVTGDTPGDPPIAYKYAGFWRSGDLVSSEIQVVSLLVGLFWEAEHSAIYKPSPNLRGVTKSIEMRRKTAAVISALREFELEFGQLIETAGGTDDSR